MSEVPRQVPDEERIPLDKNACHRLQILEFRPRAASRLQQQLCSVKNPLDEV
jgi:hypothetical protein